MKNSQEFHVAQIKFLGEQDGPPERFLKEKLTESFQQDNRVITAFLARISFDVDLQEVALCLKTRLGDDEDLANKVGKVFGATFGGHEQMSIIFLNETQEAEVIRVCRPFFSRTRQG